MNKVSATTRQKRLHIVLVEDEKYMRLLFEMYLREWFNEVDILSFQNGDAAWAELSQAEADLLVTDWRHPGLDGGELVRKLAEKKARIPVLMISANDPECIREFAGSGINVVYLQKPFGIEPLWQAFNRLVGPCDNPPRIPDYLKSPPR